MLFINGIDVVILFVTTFSILLFNGVDAVVYVFLDVFSTLFFDGVDIVKIV